MLFKNNSDGRSYTYAQIHLENEAEQRLGLDLGHLQRADPFRTPNRSDLVLMCRPADSQSGIVRMGRGVHPAARRKVFFLIFFIT
jgi:hypothetical protein